MSKIWHGYDVSLLPGFLRKIVSSTIAPLDLYVRTVGGSDSNSGLSTGFPLATLAAAVAKVPVHIALGGRVIIHLGDGTYPAPVWGTRILDDKLALIGDGAGVGDGFAELQGALFADGTSTASRLDKIGGSLTPNDPALRGRTIQLIAGTGSPQRKTIKNNTADGYIPARDFSPAPDGTTEYRILESAVELEYTGAILNHYEIAGAANTSPILVFGSGGAAVYSLNQLRLTTADGGDSPLPTYSNVGVVYYGIEIAGPGFGLELNFSHCSVYIGNDALGVFAAIPNALGFAASDTEWLGWGMSAVDKTTPGTFPNLNFDGPSTNFHMYLVVKGLLALGFTFSLYGGRLFGHGGVSADTLELTENSIGKVTGTFGSTSVVDIEAIGGNNAVEVHELANLRLNEVSLSAVSALMRIREGGQLRFGPTVTGASSGAQAVLVDSGEVYIDGVPALTGSPTGTAYDVGDGIAVPASFFTGLGDYLANPNGGVIRRIS